MVEKANNTAATVNTYGNHEMAEPNAAEVNAIPWPVIGASGIIPATPITNAVMVQTTTVSINGSYKTTNPSVTG